jgi:hypothetical protein
MTCGRGYECAECDRHFGRLSGFDARRISLKSVGYDWRCLTDAELVARELRQVNGVWVQEARFRSRPGVSGARRSAA